MRSTDTQRESYANFRRSGRDATERRLVLKVLAKMENPVTRRQLVGLTGLPQNHLTRVLYDLRFPKAPAKPLVEVTYKAKCPATHVRVHYYRLIREKN